MAQFSLGKATAGPATTSRGHVEPRLKVYRRLGGMTEDQRLCALPLADRLRIAAVDLAITGAPRALVAAVWLAIEQLDLRRVASRYAS